MVNCVLYNVNRPAVPLAPKITYSILWSLSNARLLLYLVHLPGQRPEGSIPALESKDPAMYLIQQPTDPNKHTNHQTGISVN